MQDTTACQSSRLGGEERRKRRKKRNGLIEDVQRSADAWGICLSLRFFHPTSTSTVLSNSTYLATKGATYSCSSSSSLRGGLIFQDFLCLVFQAKSIRRATSFPSHRLA